jgi:hypothetical protein
MFPSLNLKSDGKTFLLFGSIRLLFYQEMSFLSFAAQPFFGKELHTIKSETKSPKKDIAQPLALMIMALPADNKVNS